MDPVVRSYDLAMLHTASLFDLTTRDGRRQSNAWLAAVSSKNVAAGPEVVLELGAFKAEFSARARAALPDAEVHAFEANPYNIAEFSERVTRAGVQYHHLAIGDAVGDTVFNLARREAGVEVGPTRRNNSLKTKPLDIEYEEVRVPVVTVDHFLAERGLGGRPTAMWIDLEGCGYEGLVGAAGTLGSTRLLLIEVEDRPFWNGQKLAGDVMRHLVGAGFMPLARDFQSKGQYNLIFARPELLDEPAVRQALAMGFAEAGRLARIRAAAPKTPP